MEVRIYEKRDILRRIYFTTKYMNIEKKTIILKPREGMGY